MEDYKKLLSYIKKLKRKGYFILLTYSEGIFYETSFVGWVSPEYAFDYEVKNMLTKNLADANEEFKKLQEPIMDIDKIQSAIQESKIKLIVNEI